MISNNYIPEKINDANAYLDGTRMIGVAASVDLPEVNMKTGTVEGFGVGGEIDSPTIGQWESFEQEVQFNTLYSSAVDMLNPLTVVNLTFRAAQQVYDKTGGYDFKGLRVVEMGRVKKFKPGKIEKSEGMQKSGILASLTIAQAILESGWGASELATKANALFGIKADARWSGKAYSKDTKECYDGATYTTITALFRAYDSWAESVADHSAFLLANKRYAAVVGERDYKVACKAIKAAGYATDPGYPQKLIGLIEKYGLTVYDGKAEQEDKTSMNISITKKTSTHNTTAAAGRAIRYIVVHYTAGVTSKPGSAAGTASYFGSTSKQVSADFIVDDGGAVQYNGDIRNRYTWHCGGGKYNTKGGAYYGKATNRNTIGIEVCSTNDTGKMTVANDSHWRFTDKVVSNLVELVKYLMAEYGIDAAHVIRHYDVNGKPCPGIIGWNEDTGSAAKWAAFKARLGAATPGGQTGGSTNTGTATGNTALTYKVGDIVQFAGGKHYANSQATSGTTVKPGQAKVTAVAPAGKHPYHIVHTDSASTVYGWVDAAAITGKASATPAAKTYTVKAGDSLWRIAAQQLGNGARYKEIKTMNGLKNNTIHAGQVLKLPN